MVEIYSPSQKHVKNYKLGDEIEIKLNASAIIPIITDKIYKSPYSAIRELYDNEKTACHKALIKDPTLKNKQEIIIRLNRNTREFSIEGLNSQGMTTETLIKILAVLGNSGNNNEYEKGFFGIGFFSFIKLSERIIIISKSQESKEEYAYICKSALKFEQLQKENYDPLETTGFKVVLTIKNDLKLDQVENRVREIVFLSDVKTRFYVDDQIIPLEQNYNLLEYFEKRHEEFFNYKKDPSHNDLKYSLVYDYYNTDDYELIVGITTNEHRDQLMYLGGTPINNENWPYRHNNNIMLVNIKSERKYLPTPDRDRLEERSEEEINKIIESKLFDVDDRLNKVSNLDEYYKDPLRFFLHDIGKINLGSSYVKSLNHKDYNGRKVFSRLNKHLPNKKPSEFFISNTMRTITFEKLYEEKNAFCLVSQRDQSHQDFNKIGFKDLPLRNKKRIKKNGKYVYVERLTSHFSFHNYSGSHDDLTDKQKESKLIFRARDIKQDRKCLEYGDNIILIPRLANYKKALDINDIPKLINKKIFMSSYGLVDGKYLINRIDHKFQISYSDHAVNTLGYYNPDDKKNFHVTILNKSDAQLLGFYARLKNHYIYQDAYNKSWKNALEKQDLDPDVKFIYDDHYSYNLDQDAYNFLIKLNGRLKKCQ